jgi:hypothetical protein
MDRSSDPSGRAVCAFSLVVVALLVSAASAMGQAAIDQYVPSTKPGAHHGSAVDAVREATATVAPGPPSTRDRPEKKTPLSMTRSPGTGGPPDIDSGGYPLTTFVIILLALFMLGLAVRYVPDLIRRLRLRQAS